MITANELTLEEQIKVMSEDGFEGVRVKAINDYDGACYWHPQEKCFHASGVWLSPSNIGLRYASYVDALMTAIEIIVFNRFVMVKHDATYD